MHSYNTYLICNCVRTRSSLKRKRNLRTRAHRLLYRSSVIMMEYFRNMFALCVAHVCMCVYMCILVILIVSGSCLHAYYTCIHVMFLYVLCLCVCMCVHWSSFARVCHVSMYVCRFAFIHIYMTRVLHSVMASP